MRRAVLAVMVLALSACDNAPQPTAAPASASPSPSAKAAVAPYVAKACEIVSTAKAKSPEATAYVEALRTGATPPAPGSAELAGLEKLNEAYMDANIELTGVGAVGNERDLRQAFAALMGVHFGLREAGSDMEKAKQLIKHELVVSGFATVKEQCG